MLLEWGTLEDIELVGPGAEAASSAYLDIDKPPPAPSKPNERVTAAWTAWLLLHPFDERYFVRSTDQALFSDPDAAQFAHQLVSTESGATILPSPSKIGAANESLFAFQKAAALFRAAGEVLSSQKAAALFRAAREEFFEDGMDSDFSRGLISFIESSGSSAVSAIADLIFDLHTNEEIASEALRWIGRIDHPQSHEDRLRLLEKSLSSPSPKVRDGVILGLASLDDPGSIPFLQKAIQQESIAGLRQDMEEIIDQLESG